MVWHAVFCGMHKLLPCDTGTLYKLFFGWVWPTSSMRDYMTMMMMMLLFLQNKSFAVVFSFIAKKKTHNEQHCVQCAVCNVFTMWLVYGDYMSGYHDPHHTIFKYVCGLLYARYVWQPVQNEHIQIDSAQNIRHPTIRFVLRNTQCIKFKKLFYLFFFFHQLNKSKINDICTLLDLGK